MLHENPDSELKFPKRGRLNFGKLIDWYLTNLSFPKTMFEILGPLAVVSFVKEPAVNVLLLFCS
ncbi:hypothetical protein HY085_02335 [Candidatus Gottesmanbacteria bacterium]|nr:hypothetical protein [Candidatus Gottesmanbacteria bacterium]